MGNSKLLLPIAYFAPISYYQAINRYQVLLEACENYQKKSIRNKTFILGPNGVQLLTIPLVKGKTFTPIKKVRISYAEDWVKNHLQSIRTSYGTSPYFDTYFPELEELLKCKFEYLFELNKACLAWLQQRFNLPSVNYTEIFKKSWSDEGIIDMRTFNANNFVESFKYEQVYSYKFGFTRNLGVLDLIFNTGPEAEIYLNADNFSLLLN